ncbi:uncharacterized protein LOC103973783 [Musa acuminata AAA Group]|uniref:uncharacterized protein LOC103973783 n=2 Tax=Musa acuminata AAA Group TaxID=214697 RepID=UPI0031D2E2C1
MAQKPLMLKDYLELDWDSESYCAGFGCVPAQAGDVDPDADAATMRYLLDAELRGGGGGPRLQRTRSMNAMAKISAVIGAFRPLSFAGASSSSASGGRRRCGEGGFLTRSFSQRLSGSFWRMTGMAAAAVAMEDTWVGVKDIVRLRSVEEKVVSEELRSFDFPSPALSSCTVWSESDFLPSTTAGTDSSDDSLSSAGAATSREAKKGSPRARSSRKPKVDRKSTGEGLDASGAGLSRMPMAPESEGTESPQCHSEEEEQLSPMSVMDFPSGEEDEEEEADDPASPSFHRSLAKLERTTRQLLQRIGQFESLIDLEPIDVDRRFASTDCLDESTDDVASVVEEEDERALRERKAWGVLGQLKASCHVDPAEASVEKLLLDLFIQELSYSDGDANRDGRFRRGHREWAISAVRHGQAEERALLITARDWIEGTRRRDLDDFHGEATLREIERGGRWRSFEEEEDGELGVDLQGLVLGSLMEELVMDLVSR